MALVPPALTHVVRRHAANNAAGTWAKEKLFECAAILRKASREPDPMDYVEAARWSKSPKVAGALGYLEAWADVEDVTVAELIEMMEFESNARIDAIAEVKRR